MGLTGPSTTIPARTGSGRSGQVLNTPDPGILFADTAARFPSTVSFASPRLGHEPSSALEPDPTQRGQPNEGPMT